MKGLRKMLLKEKKRLESILEMTRNQLIDAPGGTLQISKTGKWVQYYHYIKEENKGKKYISIHNNKLAQELAQKSYNTRILKLTEKRLAQINKILKDNESESMVRTRISKKRISGRHTCNLKRTWRAGSFQVRKNSGRLFLSA